MNPVFHVSTLPRVITSLAWLKPSGSIELVGESGGLQRDVKTLQRGGRRFELLLLFRILFAFATISSEHPVVVRTDRQ